VSTAPVTETFPAIGTTITVATTDPESLGAATTVVRSHVERLDRAASRFRADSELAAVHAGAGKPVRVSGDLLVAVEESLLAARTTGGLVDPTVGDALQRCGYDRDFPEIDRDGPPVTLRYARVPGWHRVEVDRSAGTVRVPPGVLLDLGCTAKAGCADRAAAAAAHVTGCGVLVNLGGDLAVSGPPPAGGWVVRVADRHDAAEDEPGVTVAISGGGLATSGTAARRWRRGGREMHHIIEPASGAPAAGPWRTVTVAAPTCLAANIAATAAVVIGAGAPRWLDARAVHARLVDRGGWARAVGGWPLDALAPGQAQGAP
jgi:thiamine biosynthesis lipoprotein